MTDHKLGVTVDLRPIGQDADDPPNHYAGTLLFASTRRLLAHGSVVTRRPVAADGAPGTASG